MLKQVAAVAAALFALAGAARSEEMGYQRLLSLYAEFRAVAQDPTADDVGDYRPPAMEARRAEATRLLKALQRIDDAGWPVSQRVDYMIVLAEMRGLEFHHRVLRPWARDPSFYSVLTLGFGPKSIDSVPYPERFPIRDDAERARFKAGLARTPLALERAREALVDIRGDLLALGLAQKDIELKVFDRILVELERHHPDIAPDAAAARAATAEFRDWLAAKEGRVPMSAGVGREEFDWYLRHVLLFPYTLDEMRELGEREYARSLAFLKIEENEHKAIPMPEPVASLEAFEALRAEADRELLEFLRDRNIMTVPDWLVPPRGEGPYLMPVDRDPDRADPFRPPVKRNFFRETEDRDPRPLRAHNLPGHLLDQEMRARDQRPIRGDPRLYFIDSSRVEGWAFYLEEMLAQAGFLDARPKAREIHYILQVKRAARIAPELLMHANEQSFAEALAALTTRTPYWMEADDDTAVYDLGLYLRQPGLGVNYYFGKLQIEQLLAERARELGDGFDLKAFHDEFLAAGVIPVALIRWEMTGRDDQIEKMR